LKHPTLLHDEDKFQATKVKNDEASRKVSSSCISSGEPQCSTGAGDGSCTLAIVPVKVHCKNKGSTVDTYAFLDTGSSVSFCTDKLMNELGMRNNS
jgi:hypothetical protein